MSLPSRFKVLEPASSAPGVAGSGICFTHTITFIRAPLLPVGSVRTQLGSPQTSGIVRTLQILLVVNAFASSVTARNTVVVHRELSQRHEVDIVETNRRGHATRFAQDAAR